MKISQFTFLFSMRHRIAGTLWQLLFPLLPNKICCRFWLLFEHFFIISTRHLNNKWASKLNHKIIPNLRVNHICHLRVNSPWIIFCHFMSNLFIRAHCFIFRYTHSSLSIHTFSLSNKFGHWSWSNIDNDTVMRNGEN